MSLTEQIITQLKTDMDNVYDAGYQKGKSEGGGGESLDVSKFGIINEVTGTNIATCDYVNENPHNVEVKLSSDTVTDFSGVEVKTVLKNIFDVKDFAEKIGIPLNEDESISFDRKSEKYYLNIPYYPLVFSWERVQTNNYGAAVLEFVYKDGTNKRIADIQDSIILEKELDYVWCCYNAPCTARNFQLEINSEKTDYEPYTETTYTANADGTVDGVTSISPTMHIICNTEGVNVSAKYYCMQDVEWNRFWDNYQEFGTRVNYNSAFRGYAWTDKIFKPKYKAEIQHCTSMFEESTITEITENETDFSKATAHYSTFQNCKKLKKLMFSVKSSTILSNTMYAASELETLYIFDYQANCKETNAFALLYGLKNVVITGTIGISVKFQWSSLLTVESVQNIIDCLADLTGQTTQTITFHADVKAKLTEEQIASITAKNWTLA